MGGGDWSEPVSSPFSSQGALDERLGSQSSQDWGGGGLGLNICVNSLVTGLTRREVKLSQSCCHRALGGVVAH